jgi:ParB family chromosome partitioning protein
MEHTHEQLTVPVSRLILDAETNVRKRYDKDSIASMKASILAHGIVQPLAVRPPLSGDADLGGQLYRVFAGGRRTRALTELLAEQAVGPEYQVPIIIRDVDDRDAAELSLAENLIRHAMDPADEFKAFKQLADDGMDVAEIALRFGQTERFVRGRLALGALHPVILEALSEGQISFAAATAYTLQPDPEVQFRFWENASEWVRRNVHDIRHAMVEGSVRADGSLAHFIGEDRYRAAGGVVQEDLFGEDNFWLSGDIVELLKQERIEELRAEFLADGWSFFETLEEFGVATWQIRNLAPESVDLTEAETARMDEIAELLEGMMEDDEDRETLEAEWEALDAKTAVFTADQKAKSGIVFDMRDLHIRYGCLRPEEERGGLGPSSSSKAQEKPARDPLALTTPVLEQLGNTATDAFAKSVAGNPDLALALLAAMLELGDSFTSGRAKPSRIKIERKPGFYDFAKNKGSGTFDAAFKKYAKMDAKKKAAAIASLVSGTIDLSEAWFQSESVADTDRAKFRRACFDAFETDPTPNFDAQAFFDGSRKPVIEAAARDMGFELAGGKKSDMAKVAAIEAKKRGWLPEQLRFKGYKHKTS